MSGRARTLARLGGRLMLGGFLLIGGLGLAVHARGRLAVIAIHVRAGERPWALLLFLALVVVLGLLSRAGPGRDAS